MTADRPPETPLALPPTDHVARVLLKRGEREHAMSFLRAAVNRDPGEKACAALLKAVEARPDASVYGPDLHLDLRLIDAYTRRAMFLEALAVLRGAHLDQTPDGANRAMRLEILLAPIQEPAPPEVIEFDMNVRSGAGAVALSMADEWIRNGEQLSPDLRQRHQVLNNFLLDQAAHAFPVEQSVHGGGPLGNLLAEYIRARDVAGALDAVHAYHQQNPSDPMPVEVIPALTRLVDAMDAIGREAEGDNLRTQPMSGHNVALFQLRMGNIDVSERLFRKRVLEDPSDEVARKHLDDIQRVREAIAGRLLIQARPRGQVDPLSETMSKPSAGAKAMADAIAQVKPLLEEDTRQVSDEELAMVKDAFDAVTTETPRPGRSLANALEEDERTRQVEITVPKRAKRIPTSPELLKKNQRLPTAQGGYGAFQGPNPSDWEEDVSTEIGTPEQQAELLVQQGYTEQALGIYERMSALFPEKTKYAQRTEELRRLVEQQKQGYSVPEVPLERSVEIDLSDIDGPTLHAEDIAEAVARHGLPMLDSIDVPADAPPPVQPGEPEMITTPDPPAPVPPARPPESPSADLAPPMIRPPVDTVSDEWMEEDRTVVTEAPEMSLAELAPPPDPAEMSLDELAPPPELGSSTSRPSGVHGPADADDGTVSVRRIIVVS